MTTNKLNNLNFFGKDARFHHVGIAVKSIDEILGKGRKIADSIQKVSVALVSLNNFTIEFVEPLNESSPVTKILEKKQSIYHICFEVKNLQTAIETAKKNGFFCFTKPVPAKAFNGKKIIWLFSGIYGLIELLEK